MARVYYEYYMDNLDRIRCPKNLFYKKRTSDGNFYFDEANELFIFNKLKDDTPAFPVFLTDLYRDLSSLSMITERDDWFTFGKVDNARHYGKRPYFNLIARSILANAGYHSNGTTHILYASYHSRGTDLVFYTRKGIMCYMNPEVDEVFKPLYMFVMDNEVAKAMINIDSKTSQTDFGKVRKQSDTPLPITNHTFPIEHKYMALVEDEFFNSPHFPIQGLRKEYRVLRDAWLEKGGKIVTIPRSGFNQFFKEYRPRPYQNKIEMMKELIHTI